MDFPHFCVDPEGDQLQPCHILRRPRAQSATVLPHGGVRWPLRTQSATLPKRALILANQQALRRENPRTNVPCKVQTRHIESRQRVIEIAYGEEEMEVKDNHVMCRRASMPRLKFYHAHPVRDGEWSVACPLARQTVQPDETSLPDFCRLPHSEDRDDSLDVEGDIFSTQGAHSDDGSMPSEKAAPKVHFEEDRREWPLENGAKDVRCTGPVVSKTHDLHIHLDCGHCVGPADYDMVSTSSESTCRTCRSHDAASDRIHDPKGFDRTHESHDSMGSRSHNPRRRSHDATGGSHDTIVGHSHTWKIHDDTNRSHAAGVSHDPLCGIYYHKDESDSTGRSHDVKEGSHDNKCGNYNLLDISHNVTNIRYDVTNKSHDPKGESHDATDEHCEATSGGHNAEGRSHDPKGESLSGNHVAAADTKILQHILDDSKNAQSSSQEDRSDDLWSTRKDLFMDTAGWSDSIAPSGLAEEDTSGLDTVPAVASNHFYVTDHICGTRTHNIPMTEEHTRHFQIIPDGACPPQVRHPIAGTTDTTEHCFPPSTNSHQTFMTTQTILEADTDKGTLPRVTDSTKKHDITISVCDTTESHIVTVAEDTVPSGMRLEDHVTNGHVQKEQDTCFDVNRSETDMTQPQVSSSSQDHYIDGTSHHTDLVTSTEEQVLGHEVIPSRSDHFKTETDVTSSYDSCVDSNMTPGTRQNVAAEDDTSLEMSQDSSDLHPIAVCGNSLHGATTEDMLPTVNHGDVSDQIVVTNELESTTYHLLREGQRSLEHNEVTMAADSAAWESETQEPFADDDSIATEAYLLSAPDIIDLFPNSGEDMTSTFVMSFHERLQKIQDGHDLVPQFKTSDVQVDPMYPDVPQMSVSKPDNIISSKAKRKHVIHRAKTPKPSHDGRRRQSLTAQPQKPKGVKPEHDTFKIQCLRTRHDLSDSPRSARTHREYDSSSIPVIVLTSDTNEVTYLSVSPRRRMSHDAYCYNP